MTAQPLQFRKGENIMAKISTGQSFNAGDQITSTKLNNIVGTAFLDSDSVTGTTLNLTSGQLKVATNGITDNEIANNSVTYAKIQDVAASSVIGNTTGSTATPGNVAILDEDNMASNSATSLATQQSIKAYVDNGISQVSSTPEIHSFHTAPILTLVSDKISVNDFSEGIDSTGSNATKIDQAVGDGGTFKMFKIPASGTCVLEIDAALQDTDSGSGRSFRLDLISCTSETGVTKTSDGSVIMTTLVTGATTGASSTAGTRGSSRVKYQKVMANGTFFYLKVIRNSGAVSCDLTATVKVTSY